MPELLQTMDKSTARYDTYLWFRPEDLINALTSPPIALPPVYSAEEMGVTAQSVGLDES